MRVKVYVFKEEISVSDEQQLIGRMYEGYPFIPFSEQDPMRIPEVKENTYQIESVGIFSDEGFVHSHFVIVDDSSNTSLSHVVHRAGVTQDSLAGKTKDLKEELRALRGLTFFQRVFQWKKFIQKQGVFNV